VIGGDSHTVVSEPVVVGRTVVTQAGSKLRWAGVTVVTKKGGETSIENRLVALDTIPPSPRFEEMVRRYNADPALLAPIGVTAGPFGAHGVDNLVVGTMRAAIGADVALYHAGGIRIDTLSGPVNTADLYRIEPFLSEVYTLRMTSGQIKGLIMNKFNDPNDKESHGPDLIPDGFRYTIEPDEAGEAVNVLFDRPERASYLVAIPDYVYKNYLFDRSEEGVETDIMITSILRDYITTHSPVVPDNAPRITIE
jgi:5'-nucleotidase